MLTYLIAIAILTVVLFFAAVFFARPKTDAPEKRAQNMARHWKQVLELSDDQAVRVERIMFEQERWFDLEQENLLRSMPEARNQTRDMRAHRRSYRKVLAEVLTPEQQRLARKRIPELRPISLFMGPRRAQRRTASSAA